MTENTTRFAPPPRTKTHRGFNEKLYYLPYGEELLLPTNVFEALKHARYKLLP